MNRSVRLSRRFVAAAMAFVAIGVMGLAAAANAAKPDTTVSAPGQRPNILFVYTDDQGPWTIGVSGNPQAKTPHMDRLFRQGAYLVNSFTTTPVCSPSRASLMASRYGTELAITDWIHPGKEPELGLDPATVTWPEVLAEAGYTNGLIGKWHLGIPDRFHPTKTGFHYFMGFREGGTRLKDPTLEVDGQPKKLSGFTVNILTDHALEFIRRNKDGPFLLCVHYRAPHAPWLPLPDEDWAPFEDLDPQIPNPDYPKLRVDYLKRVMREYLGSVASVDRNLGRMLTLLDELDLTRKTVVIYSSDHGYNVSHHALLYKGNARWMLTEPPPWTENVPKWQRPNMFDTSIRVPTAVRWPGRVEPGTVITQTISNLDWYPTILAMAGAEVPGGELVRGRNFLPLLEGRQIPDWDNGFYAQYSMHHGARIHMRMYRTPKWKLVRDFLNPERDELYNLEKDPDETSNLIRDPSPEVQEVIRTLHAKIVARMRETNDPALKLVP